MNRQAFNSKKYEAAYFDAFGEEGYMAGFGPPLNYNTGNPNALGGNPDVTPYLKRPIKLPAPNEAGWKDTVQAPPGHVTRLVVRWAPTDLPADTPPEEAFYPFDPDHGHGYVWHCHILDHEDNEMMRPVSVTSNPAVDDEDRDYIEGTDY